MANDRVSVVKQANDIVDVVGAYLTLRPAGGTFKGLCPFHNDSRPSFDVDPRRQRYRCWSCGKFGDVLSFVQEFEKISFREALELLARRANIDLGPASPTTLGRAQLLDALRWASRLYADYLLDGTGPDAEAARLYVAQRQLRGDMVRKWGLGYAPLNGQWLLERAEADGVSLEHLEIVGLVAPRSNGNGYYDRFRDRILFPIRDGRGQVVGFGGRILPGSPLADRAPKYYNSCDSPLFNKSEQLYGIDLARAAAEKVGYLAIVEGYTDVMMAHQQGIPQVVATMGTALNAKHILQIRRFVPRVVLVYDADDGGDKGVDRALELFASHDMELAVATLPTGMDPCDLLVSQGSEPFRRTLESATDALEFKLTRMSAREDTASIEGRRRIVDAVLGIIALADPMGGESNREAASAAGAVKIQLMLGRIARRLGVQERTLWARLDELRQSRQQSAEKGNGSARETPARSNPGGGPAAPDERQLLEVLLADARLVARAAAPVTAGGVQVEEIAHPGLRRLLEGLYALHQSGQLPTLDRLRETLDNPPLIAKAFELQEVGLEHPDREAWLADLLVHFREKRQRAARQELAGRLQAVQDPQQALELLRQLQHRPEDPGSTTGTLPGVPVARP
jgi:DNA primase